MFSENSVGPCPKLNLQEDQQSYEITGVRLKK